MFKRKSSDSKAVSEPPALETGPAAQGGPSRPAAAAKPAESAGGEKAGGADVAPGRAQARRAGDSVAAAANRRPEYRPNVPSKPGAPAPASAADNEDRKLVVGRGIRLSGEIKKCEKLVVEGEVEANLNDCLSLEIAAGGLFNGAAIVEEADISGRFDGELVVNGRLYLRETGRINGKIRYADLEIQRGGKIAGSIDMMDATEGDGDAPAAAEAQASEATSEPADSAKNGNGNGEAAEQGEPAPEAAAKANGSDAAEADDKPSLPL